MNKIHLKNLIIRIIGLTINTNKLCNYQLRSIRLESYSGSEITRSWNRDVSTTESYRFAFVMNRSNLLNWDWVNRFELIPPSLPRRPPLFPCNLFSSTPSVSFSFSSSPLCLFHFLRHHLRPLRTRDDNGRQRRPFAKESREERSGTDRIGSIRPDSVSFGIHIPTHRHKHILVH